MVLLTNLTENKAVMIFYYMIFVEDGRGFILCNSEMNLKIGYNLSCWGKFIFIDLNDKQVYAMEEKE